MYSLPYSSFYDYNTQPNSYYPRQGGWGGYRPQQPADDPYAQARARALAEQRARKAQWLPDEVDDDQDDDWEYNQLGPRERMYLDARRRQQELERQQKDQELARKRELEDRRWQNQLEQKQNEEDARRQKILEEQRRVHREKEEARQRAKAAKREARARSRGRSPSIPRTPTPKAKTPEPEAPPAPVYVESHEHAASRIQNQYRIHRSFKAIADLEKQFDDSKSHFTFPTTIDFQKPGSEDGHISVFVSRSPDDESSAMDVDNLPEGKLAFTSSNFGIHGYLESMLKLLTKLDGVESWGSKAVRTRRRDVVKKIEAEIARVDAYWKGAWHNYLVSQQRADDTQQDQQQDGQVEEKQSKPTRIPVEGSDP